MTRTRPGAWREVFPAVDPRPDACRKRPVSRARGLLSGVIGLLAAALFGGACAEEKACFTGDFEACTCADGRPGFAACDAAKDAYGACGSCGMVPGATWTSTGGGGAGGATGGAGGPPRRRPPRPRSWRAALSTPIARRGSATCTPRRARNAPSTARPRPTVRSRPRGATTWGFARLHEASSLALRCRGARLGCPCRRARGSALRARGRAACRGGALPSGAFTKRRSPSLEGGKTFPGGSETFPR